MKKSKAQQYWREFEALSIELIRKEFDIEPTFVVLTPPSKDDGYDGAIFYQVSQESNLDLSFRILLESKLRTGKDGLGLRSFAATLVIAHNNAANALIIVSNQFFTKQAVEEAARFGHSTRIKIRLVDGPAVASWVVKRYEQLESKYPKEFLEWLMEKYTKDQTDRQFEIVLPGEDRGSSETRANLAIGNIDDGSLSSCEITFKTRDINSIELAPVVGLARRKLVDNLVSCLSGVNGISVLEGASGSGKSHLISHAVNIISKRDILIHKIDLASLNSVQTLFLAVYSRLTGLDLRNLLIDPDVISKKIPSILSGQSKDDEFKKYANAVATVISSKDSDYSEQKELNKSLLTNYLKQTAQTLSKTSKFATLFENLNLATSEVLDFLLSVINVLKDYGVVLVELRTDSDALHTSPTDWQIYQKLFLRCATESQLTVPMLDKADAYDLIEYWLPSFGPERAKVIIERVGLSPFLIEIACQWLITSGIVKFTTKEAVSIKEVEIFFEGISPSKAKVVVRNLIEFWISSENPMYRKAVIGTSVLSGELPILWLRQLVPEKSSASIADELLKTGIFSRHLTRRDFLQVRHDLLRECLEAFLHKSPYETEEVSKSLLGLIKEIYEPGLEKDRIHSILLFHSKESDSAFKASVSCASNFKRDGQLTTASEMWSLAYRVAEDLQEQGIDRDHNIAESLLNLLEVEQARNRIQTNINQGRLAALETHLNLSPHLRNNINFRYRLETLIWRRLFLLEQFEDALDLANKLMRQVVDDSNKLATSLQTAAFSACALTYKGMGFREKSAEIFDDGVRRYPGNIILMSERLSNIAAANLNINPKLSLDNYLEMKTLLTQNSGYSIRRSLHLEVDIAMAHFLLFNYKEAQEYAEKASAVALSNGIDTQEGRSRNITACCYWVNGDLKTASTQIELAVFAAEKSLYLRFLWRIRANATSIFAELGDEKSTELHARETFRLILEPRKRNFSTLSRQKSYRKQRWYVALLAVCMATDNIGFEELTDELASAVELTDFSKDLNSLRLNNWQDETFKGTTHIHANRIMITG